MRRAVAFAALTATFLAAAAASALELPFHKTRLKNGLTVIVHEDHTLPLTAVNLAYRVGSRDEETKRTGFAHLFEHLMFMGTTRVPPKMFDAWMETAGGANNAWTSNDLTDYHEAGPSGLMQLFLWLEADRMQTLGKEIDKPKLDLQRDVVRNERRQQIENQPYGKVELLLPELLYPEGHPYHHPVIGSHEDLESAAVDDVQRFFARFYVPSNASLVVAGDVKAPEVEALAEKYFGAIPAGERPKRAEQGAPPRVGKVVRQTMEDHVELAKLVIAFHSPGHLAEGDAELDLLAAVLSTGKSSRLYKALVYDKPLAQSVRASQDNLELSSTFNVEIVARPGVSLDDLEKAVDAVLADAIKTPPSDEEIKRAKNTYETRFVDGLQSLTARAQLLNMYEIETGDPGFVNKDLGRYRAATAAGILAWAQKTLTLGDRVVLRVVPQGNSAASPKGGKK